MLEKIRAYFCFENHGTDFRKEILAGATTFLTMAYIMIVNPAILEVAGIPRDASVTATILTSALGSLLMGIYARRPFAVAPLMGENAFIAFTVVKSMGCSWEIALGAVCLSGFLFALLTLLNVRGFLARAIPLSLKYSFAAGIGLFLVFIGLNECGIVVLGVPGAPVRAGNFTDPKILLSIAGFFIIMTLIYKRKPSAILTGILSVSFLSFLFKLTSLPSQWVGMPGSLSPIMGKLDLGGALEWKLFPVIFTVFMMAFVDTLGTLFGLSVKANLLDSDGNLPEIEKPMLTDALATSCAAFLGTTTTGAYIESASGIESGGRTGFASVITSLLFLASLFFSPLFSAIPACAYAPALIAVGLLMIDSVRHLVFDDPTELVPAFLTIVLMIFTFNIGIGMTSGFIAYLILKLTTGRVSEISKGMWVLSLLSLLFFILSPR